MGAELVLPVGVRRLYVIEEVGGPRRWRAFTFETRREGTRAAYGDGGAEEIAPFDNFVVKFVP